MDIYTISAVSGLVIVLASLALLWKEKVYVDTQTKQVTQIELPLGIKLRTSVPIIAVIFMGIALIVIAEVKNHGRQFVSLTGKVTSPQPLMVYVIAQEQKVTTGDVQLEVPADATYRVIFLHEEGASAIDSQSVDLLRTHRNPYQLRDLDLQALVSSSHNLPSEPVHREPDNVVGQYK